MNPRDFIATITATAIGASIAYGIINQPDPRLELERKIIECGRNATPCTVNRSTTQIFPGENRDTYVLDYCSSINTERAWSHMNTIEL